MMYCLCVLGFQSTDVKCGQSLLASSPLECACPTRKSQHARYVRCLDVRHNAAHSKVPSYCCGTDDSQQIDSVALAFLYRAPGRRWLSARTPGASSRAAAGPPRAGARCFRRCRRCHRQPGRPRTPRRHCAVGARVASQRRRHRRRAVCSGPMPCPPQASAARTRREDGDNRKHTVGTFFERA